MLEDVSCSSSTSCTAVGYKAPKFTRSSLAERWNGSEWSILGVQAPPLSENKVQREEEEKENWEYGWLTSVSCTSSTSCLATGAYRSTEWEQFPLAQAYGGSEFSLAPLPKLSQGSTLEAVSCASSISCLATGHNATGSAALALAYNGKEWATQAAITPAGKTGYLNGVACPEALVCTAVGESGGEGEVATLAERIEPRNQKATTESATDVTREAASLGATVNPHGLDTHYSFEYGPTKHYGSSTASRDAGSGIEDVAASASISSLEPSRFYHYRVIATSEIGTTYGEDRTFTTPPPTFAFALGAEDEEGEGQVAAPGGVATDAAGNAYVSDPGNHRVAKFSPTGEYLSEFGEVGSGDGQFGEGIGPIAVGPEGDVYVADPAHHRVERFDASGEYVGQLGSEGAGNGQFGFTIGGIAVDQGGVLWVSDSANHRVERFNSKGEYLGKLGSEGVGNGQFASPRAIAIDPSGNAWVVDLGHERIEEFTASGTYLRQTGKIGKGNGELTNPAGVAADAAGNLWVVDSGDGRLEEFDAKGLYLSQFGEAGEGEGQLDEPSGLAIDPQGSLLIANLGSSQVQKWFVQPGDVSSEENLDKEDDPKVEVKSSAGLVESVEGQEAGQTTYSHTGELLSAVDGPKGKTEYQYDSQERLTKVTLPNGTWGEVKYDEFGRVKSVTVSAEGGKAKTTFFAYKEEPRRTTVSPEGAPITVYDIAPDGSVLKWWNKQEPPEIENLSGSLYANKETPEPVEPGDYELLVQAHSVEGIAKIEVVANGNQLVDEKTCKQEYEKEGTECQTLEDPWVTETANWPPGILSLEVIVTDSVEGTETVPNTESTKFWVNIPYTPPPDPEAEEPPKFNEVLRFREEFGLDLDLKGNELAIDERIFDLIGDWNNPHTPAGEVARASMGRWGVPLRAVDVAEMEYRERYAAEAARLIPKWAEAHAQPTYAGYYINQRQGGIIHVGFTSASQSQQLSQLIAEIGEIAPGRISTFEGQPRYSYKELLEAWRADSAALGGQPIAESMVSQAIDMINNKVEVKTEDVVGMESFLVQHSDPGEFEVVHAIGRPMFRGLDTRPAFWTEGGESPPKYNVREAERRIFAGDSLMDAENGELGECTAGWGATEPGGIKPNGEQTLVPYVITAGHCFSRGLTVYRFAREGKRFVEFPVGSVTARAYGTSIEGNETDAEAVRLRSGFSPPSWIFASKGSQLRPGAPALPVTGEPVCHSGVEGGFRCGTVKRFTEQWIGDIPAWLWEAGISSCEGDSGGPYWQPEGNTPLGIEDGGPSHKLPDGRLCGGPSYFTPLVESKAEEMGVEVGRNVGVFQASGLSNMKFHGAVN